MAVIRIDATQVPMSYDEKGRVAAYVDFLLCAPVADRRNGVRFWSWEGRVG